MISFIVPTTGRCSLAATIASIRPVAGDEILVIGRPCELPHSPQIRYIECDSFKDFGATERTIGIAAARGSHLAFMDDDDAYAPGARELMESAIAADPDRPVLFRMRYPSGFILWHEPVLRMGNVSTQMMLLPNDPAKLGRWQSGRRECDYDFLASMRWPAESIVWRSEILSHLSDHDDPVRKASMESACA